MKTDLRSLSLILFCFLLSWVVGCGGDNGPVTPATTSEVPTTAAPPPGEEEQPVTDDR
jgi:hypothetical protein